MEHAPSPDDRAANGKPSSFSEQAISRVIDSPPKAPQPLRILVAEDDVINRSLMLLMLKGMGYQADAVADGTEVLKALGQHNGKNA